MDSQAVEILGRNRLVSELVAAGIEVARPERDRGIDLIAYLDRVGDVRTFRAVPIQMKAASAACFSLDAKYKKTNGLVIAYVWHLSSPEHGVTYATSYNEALKIAAAMGYTTSPSWRKGSYSTSHPSARLRDLLEPFRTSPKSWRNRITQSQ